MNEEVAAKSAGEGAPAPKSKKVMVLGVLVGVMLAEAIVVFVLVKKFTAAANPQDAQAAVASGLDAHDGTKHVADVEVRIGEFRVQNRKGQQSYTVSFSVFAAVPPAEKPKHEGKKEEKGEGGEGEGKAAGPVVKPEDAVVAAKAAKIKDRFTRVIRSLDPECFAEADLATLRGKLKGELSDVLGSELKINEVLLTDFSCSPDS